MTRRKGNNSIEAAVWKMRRDKIGIEVVKRVSREKSAKSVARMKMEDGGLQDE